MADETLTTQTAPETDSPGGLSTGQESTQTAVSTAAPNADIEKRFKDTQAAFTKSQQELKATQERLAELDSRYKELSPMAERFGKLQAALQDNPTEQAQSYTPEELAAADRLISQTPAYQKIATQFQMFEQQAMANRQKAHQYAIAKGAEEITKLRSLDESKQAALRAHIEKDPILLAGIQNAMDEKSALRAFDRAYRDLYFDDLEKNSLAQGTAAVEKKLNDMEKASAVEKPTTTGGATESINFSGDIGDYFTQVATGIANKMGM